MAACGPSEERIEADRIGHAIDVLRNAPAHATEGRLALVEELEKQPAKGALAVAARDACARAYRTLEEANALERSVRKGLEGADPSPALLKDLADAEAKLSESREAMPVCETAVADLRRAHR
jgi:hypothetical protein